ncbi:MAG: 50S ribosomal protein L21 [Candidatus Eisenbacteria bacterium]|uniref:Large ribosomal subunit protein bL21 n=1 Tax=Eiseniibacteriota bacterium TaxID=2212470 RepID=A0A7Y2E9C4_UNCEI|nr:50S ribosomal protein L21 [Candidatus Eisenbacteria bacterium]
MYAVVEVAGFQYKVAPGETVQVPRLEHGEGSSVTLDQVLMVNDGGKVRVGSPTVEGATVSAEIVSHGRSSKLRAGRFMRRKDYRRTWGHRQHFTELKIGSISG